MELKALILILLGLATVAAQNIDLESFPGEACYRNCDGSPARVCYFKLVFEHYSAMGPPCLKCLADRSKKEDCFATQCVTADGVERGVMAINRQIPAPAMHVCKNDIIVADVVNLMKGASTTLHWHGFSQKETPWMDGVPYLTQCPVNFQNTFRYQIKAREAGTQWYHSHAGVQRVNGLFGGVVVRRPSAEDPNKKLYDFDLKEHLIILSDWKRHAAEDHTVGLRYDITLPDNLLINGKGTVITKRQHSTPTPLQTFRVKKGFRYRFRMVNSMNFMCPGKIEIENHKLTVITTDSFDIKPVDVDSIVIQPGERYDFVISANQTGDTFWIRYKPLGFCEVLANTDLQQLAVLSYAPPAESDIELAYPVKKFPVFNSDLAKKPIFLNHPNTRCFDDKTTRKDFCVTDLESYESRQDILDAKPDQQIVVGFDQANLLFDEIFGPGNIGKPWINTVNDSFTGGSVNNIRFTLPSVPLISQFNNFKEADFCQKDQLPKSCANSTERYCYCTHRYKIKLNSIVEMVVVDESAVLQPVFIPVRVHGHTLSVVGIGQVDDPKPLTLRKAKAMVDAGEYVAPKHNVIKDTISIPPKGFTVFRFRADNPGFWFVHCHYEWHSTTGMAFLIQVGEPEEMPKPPSNFPKCNNFVNPVPQSALY